jgi:hypothetical protein
MAKALKKRQPYSSVDRFFSGASLEDALGPQEVDEAKSPKAGDEGAIAAAVEAAVSAPEPSLASPTPEPETPSSLAEPPSSKQVVIPGAESNTRQARQAITVMPQREASPAPAMRTAEAVDRQREFQLTRSADETLEDLILMYKRATGAEVTRSHVLRAILKAIAARMPELKREAQAIGPLRRPSNARGFEEAREEFEDQIKESFVRAMA